MKPTYAHVLAPHTPWHGRLVKVTGRGREGRVFIQGVFGGPEEVVRYTEVKEVRK
jgi:hypothetical protein